MLGDAEDEGFRTFETPEVLGTWRQRYTAFNAPWKTDSGVTPAMGCLFQHCCFSASKFTHFILIITFWIVSLEHHSLWLHLFGIICSWSQDFSALVPWSIVFAVGIMSPLLMDTLSHLMVEKNKRMFCCLHSSSCFGSVEQLTRGPAGICCGQSEWTGVAWQLKGFVLPPLRKLFHTSCFQGLPVSSGPFVEQKTWEKLLQSLQSSREAVADKDISTWFLITRLFRLVTNQLPLATQSGTSYSWHCSSQDVELSEFLMAVEGKTENLLQFKSFSAWFFSLLSGAV